MVLLVTPLLPGLVLYAVIGSVFGEQVLEAPSGPTWFGNLALVASNIVGGLMAVFAKPLTRLLPPGSVALAAAGSLLGLALLAIALLTLGEVGDANIGAGLLVLVGAPLLGFSAVSLFGPRRQPRPGRHP